MIQLPAAMPGSEKDAPSSSEAILATAVSLLQLSAAENEIRVSGDSMYPLLRHGDQVRVQYGTDGIKRGTLVVFRQGESMITHRVLNSKAGPDGLIYVTKGDRVLKADPPVRSGDILGRVLMIKRGSMQMRVDTPAWRAAAWLLAILMLLVERFRSRLEQSGRFSRPGRARKSLHRLSLGAQTLISFALLVLQLFISRWEDPDRRAMR